ncbi:MAG: hypothetical protein JWP59_4705 [Massilia sp.]|jgi:hypothetical protein|nr:hypothetical protein [Massilia sp.]
MKRTTFVHDGEILTLFQDQCGTWCCPVCGSIELTDMPYYPGGGASFDICHSCNFEFGYDDDPLASGTISGINNNWLKWRLRLLEGVALDPARRQTLLDQLGNIEIYVF